MNLTLLRDDALRSDFARILDINRRFRLVIALPLIRPEITLHLVHWFIANCV